MVKALRPQLPIEVPSAEHALAHFQTNVLRPILKFQHEVLMQYFEAHLKRTHTDLAKIPLSSRITYITQMLNRNQPLKYMLFGMIWGMLTEEEALFYEQNHQELNKRLTQFLAKRLCDGWCESYPEGCLLA